MTLRSSCLGLRAKIFVKKVSKQSRLSFKVGQGVPLFTHVQNRTTLAEVALKIREKGDTAEVASVRACAEVHQFGRSCHTDTQEGDMAEVASVQKCAEVHDLAEVP